MTEQHVKQVKTALVKARGQLERILKMVESDKYCMDVIQQSNALIGILRGVNNKILESHLLTCGSRLASRDREGREQFVREIIRACEVSQRKH